MPRETLAPPAAFGAALREERVKRGWSLRQAALAAGVSAMLVTRAEQGRNIGLVQALALAGAYGTTIDALLGIQPSRQGGGRA